MKKLVSRFGDAVKGVLSGFDRMVFKGLLRPLAYEQGAMEFLLGRGVLNRDYKRWMLSRTDALVESVDRFARDQTGRGITSLNGWRHDKEKLARERQKQLGIESGLIGVWSYLESGMSYRAEFSAEAGYPQLRRYNPQCRHLYFYLEHEKYGWMNVRLQTWFPYHIQIALNGRLWLRRRLESRGMDFLCQGNKFLYLEDNRAAQRMLREQLNRDWPWLLNSFLPIAFPTMKDTLGTYLSYYWTLWQSEWATDLILDAPAALAQNMASVLRHALISGNSTGVLRYMGRPLTAECKPYRNCPHEIMSRVLEFHDGVRVRHWVDHNSVKVYNQQNVLRVETTINAPQMFRVHRRAEKEDPEAPKQLRVLRKGVADIPLRAQVSQEVNNRFMDTLATFSDETPMAEVLAPHSSPRTKQGRRIRALDIAGKDRALLQAIAHPRFTVAGMTNAELRETLRATPWAKGRSDQQLAARITRHLRLLRDQGLIRKMPKRRRYQLTPKGQQLTSALAALLAASTQQLIQIAA